MHDLVHREESRFSIRIDLTAEFDQDYEGDGDGYAWLEQWRKSVQPRLVRAVFDALRSDPSFDAVPTSRGTSPDENLEIRVTWKELTPARTIDQ